MLLLLSFLLWHETKKKVASRKKSAHRKKTAPAEKLLAGSL